jgi:long-chain acyl-CoA synthetase
MPATLPPVHATVVAMLAAAAARAGDREALVCGDERLTYREYANCVAGFADELRRLGAAGERVALILGNAPDMAIAMFAVHAAGAQAVPVNPIYTARELDLIVGDAQPIAVLYDEAIGEAVAPVLERHAIPHRIAIGNAARRLLAWRGQDGLTLPAGPQRNALATLQYTGGTSGRPKGVDITHAQMAINISQREALLPTLAERERVLCIMPLFHVYAVHMCLHLAVYCRGTLVMLPRYRPEWAIETLQRERITAFAGGPTVFTGLLGFPGFAGASFPDLRISYSGSAPLPEEVLRRWEAATACPILEGYGQTEAGPVLSFNPQEGKRKPGSVGVPVPLTEIEIVDTESGTVVLPPGERGEIRAKGPQIMSGYRNLPAETAAALRGGWLYTGDIGEIDADGYLFIRDRKKDMAIVGGYNVYPREIDEVLYGHSDVSEVAAVGVPDAYRGEIIKAFVVARPGSSPRVDDLLAHCRENLARYKVPAAIEMVATLPKTPVGKIDKKALREMAAASDRDLIGIAPPASDRLFPTK